MDLTPWSEIATIVSTILAVAGLVYTADQIRLSRVASSAALVVELNNSLRKAWIDYLQEEDKEIRAYLLGDVFDTLKLVESLERDRLFKGKSGRFVRKVLANHREALKQDDAALRRLKEMDVSAPGSRLADIVRRSVSPGR